MTIRTNVFLAIRWANILLGRSYYHVSQPIGRYFSCHQIEGYYNDLTEKADWKGKSDEEGIPINKLTNGEKVYFPITIAQMALGVHDLWLETGDIEMKEKFLKLATWLKQNQDKEGGWSNPWNYLKPSSVSNYSAMAQGEAISVLVRGYLLTKETSFLDCAQKAFNFLLKPVEQGGCSFHNDRELYLEEYPEMPRNTVLNGWIFAIFGIYDLMLLTKEELVKEALAKTLKTLENSLKSYDCGYWSYYDLQENMASPFYHSLHVSLLDALYRLTGTTTFKNCSNLWEDYEKKTLNKSRALAVKVWQKLRNPVKVTVA